MKKLFWAPLALAAAGVTGTAYAVEISNLEDQSCGRLSGTWHFVNNQVPEGSGTGHLDATWTRGSCSVDSIKVLKYVQHFYCSSAGRLLSASTNLGGRLVLSDFTCEEKKCDTTKCE